ncbi:MAG: hypothetical protein OEY94_06190 [Alphaproteobacteria bacterium]|nr:hypothetical protein [Alphaproteobacteria bacterium]
MKYFILTLLIGFFVITSQGVIAADEFGSRFTGETPAGMAEGTYEPEETPAVAMDDPAEDLQDIMPAAGEEEEPTRDETPSAE